MFFSGGENIQSLGFMGVFADNINKVSKCPAIWLLSMILNTFAISLELLFAKF